MYDIKITTNSGNEFTFSNAGENEAEVKAMMTTMLLTGIANDHDNCYVFIPAHAISVVSMVPTEEHNDD